MADFKNGSSGGEVKKLQEMLIAAQAKPKIKATGKFDGPTEEALKYFQKKNKLKPDGVATPKIFAALRAAQIKGLDMTISDYKRYIQDNERVREQNHRIFEKNCARLDTIIRRSKELGPDAIKKLNANLKEKAKREAWKNKSSQSDDSKDKKEKDEKPAEVTTQVKSADDYKKIKEAYIKHDTHCNDIYKRWLTFANGIVDKQTEFETAQETGDRARAELCLKLAASQDAKARKMIDQWSDLVAKKKAVDKNIEGAEAAIKEAMVNIAGQP